MQLEYSQKGSSVELRVSGRFTFADYPAFRKLIGELIEIPADGYVIDLSQVEFIDSAGLGMLLLARDEARRVNRKVSLRGASGQVERVLGVARFEALFDSVS